MYAMPGQRLCGPYLIRSIHHFFFPLNVCLLSDSIIRFASCFITYIFAINCNATSAQAGFDMNGIGLMSLTMLCERIKLASRVYIIFPCHFLSRIQRFVFWLWTRTACVFSFELLACFISGFQQCCWAELSFLLRVRLLCFASRAFCTNGCI